MNFKLLVNTIKYLKPVQFLYRVKGKISFDKVVSYTSAPQSTSLKIMIPELDLNTDYIEKYDYDLIKSGKINILNSVIPLSFSEETKKELLPLQWFNLLYFEYAVTLAAKYYITNNKKYVDSFEKIYEEYLSAGVQYEPYVISLHIPNILIALELFGSALNDSMHETIKIELYNQYKYLLKHTEKHLLCNHYLENIKCLIIASLYFGDSAVYHKAIKELKRQTKEQILPDGMHFERSPMYHKIVIEDYLRLIKVFDDQKIANNQWLLPVFQRMINAMYVLEEDSTITPLFNDSGDNVSKKSNCLLKASKEVAGITPNNNGGGDLLDAGYYLLKNSRMAVLIDSGSIGPLYNPGHAHNDCLSFEMMIDNERIFVNSGTYQYQDDLREYFRSTRAHNTIMMDKCEQSQCWGEHRVAKRLKVLSAEKKGCFFRGRYKNYRGMIHTRSIELTASSLIVFDTTEKAKKIDSYIHISPKYSIDDSLVVHRNNGDAICRIEPINCGWKHIKGLYSEEFGEYQENDGVLFSWNSDDAKHGFKIILV